MLPPRGPQIRAKHTLLRFGPWLCRVALREASAEGQSNYRFREPVSLPIEWQAEQRGKNHI